MTPILEALCDRLWQERLEADPLWATLLGERDRDDLLPDPSAEADAARAERLRTLLAEAEALDGAGLDQRGRVIAAALAEEARRDLADATLGFADCTVAPVLVGPHAPLFERIPRTVLASEEQAEALLRRLEGVDTYLQAAVARLREGVAAGRTPVARGVRQAIRQVDAYLATPVAEDPFLEPEVPPAWFEAPQLSARLEVAVRERVRAGMVRYRDELVTHLLPVARPDDRCGASWLPDGNERYAAAVRRHTGLELDPRALHQQGLDILEALDDEYRALGSRALGTDDVAALFQRLREDPSLRFTTADEVAGAAEAALRRAEAAVPDWFGLLPIAPCVVEPMSPHEAPDGTVAYYIEPALDGSRPGTYVINTSAPETRTRFEAEALAFHEAVPGHHTQIALGHEVVGLPPVLRTTYLPAFSEGWALYSERLADEMGLYEDELGRLGMLTFDSWRAGRLVVDTGMHHLGWSRAQAVEFLTTRTPLARNNIANEVDRYISWPGQALAYKVGQLEIVRLREEAERRLGSRFDVREFHDAVLGNGPLPLPVLGDVVRAWLDDGSTATA